MEQLQQKIYQVMESRDCPVTIGWLSDRFDVSPKELSLAVRSDGRYIRAKGGYILKTNYRRATYR